MNKHGTYKVVGGKVVMVRKHERYDPEPVVTKPCRRECCRPAEAVKAEPDRPVLYTGLYL